MSETVKVMVRCRPFSKSESDRGNFCIVKVDEAGKQILLDKPNSSQSPKSFTYDSVFGQESRQSDVYEQVAFQIVESVVQGYNGTIFAYGQTGCGKTFTMMGDPTSQEKKGIIPRTFTHILATSQGTSAKNYLIRCSFIQIYNEQIHDLLAPKTTDKLQLKESPDKGVFVKDLGIHVVKSAEQMEKLMEMGFQRRAVGQTAMNQASSRSHSIFAVYVEAGQTDSKGAEKYTAGKLNLVDLAGSQRQSKTHATGQRLKQATKINLSLSALGNVISALVDGKTQHVPYRDSKLTRLLQDSLGGNTKTVMVAALSPADYNYEQTLSTLRYASRAKFIQNKPKINEDPKDAMLREYADEIKRLKMMLQGKLPLEMSQPNPATHSSQQSEKLREKEQELLSEKVQKEQLRKQLEALQSNFKSAVPTSSPATSEKQLQKYKRMKQKLRAQRKKEQQLKQQSKQRQKQLFSIQKNYQSLSQEVQSMRQRFTIVKKKYVESLTELRDIQQQHEQQKQQFLDTIREQEKELKFFKSVVSILLSGDQLDVLRRAADWDDELKDYRVPLFVMRDKKISFPKMKGAELVDFVESQRNKKQIVLEDRRPPPDTDIRRTNQSFQMPSRFLRDQAKMRLSNQSVQRIKEPQKKIPVNVVLQPVGNREGRDKVKSVSDTYNQGKKKLDPIQGPSVFKKSDVLQ